MKETELNEIEFAIARLHASIMAVVVGMFSGVTLFIATAWLLVKGGENVGQTLSLLGHFFPGYSVTWGGAFVGLVYGVLAGAIVGYCLALIYNLIAAKRQAAKRSAVSRTEAET